jgi:hypothetical protein
LREGLGHPTLHPGDGTVESFLRGIEFVHDQQRLVTFFLEGHRGDDHWSVQMKLETAAELVAKAMKHLPGRDAVSIA